MSRLLQTDANQGKTKNDTGPAKWMAPESIKSATYSTHSDVWTFGIVMYEVLAQQEPHLDKDFLEAAIRIRDEGLTPSIPETVHVQFKEIMMRCWQYHNIKRPTMEEVYEALMHISKTL